MEKRTRPIRHPLEATNWTDIELKDIMQREIPYMLYLTFDRPVEKKSLLDLMTNQNLLKIDDEPIDGDFKNSVFQFKSDISKKVLFYVGTNTKDDCCENINIAFLHNNDLNIIKDVFSFLTKLDRDNVTLIDQEIKNELFVQNINSSEKGQPDLSDKWIDEQQGKAMISLNFDDFYNNSFKLSQRNALLGK